ncbi:beta-lactamase-like protein [Schizothecium vesticola]|uniref:Beta-lactamase-like protein n=1 Tax=Schizothecium vesticola TaxID=314040 RepID=A0AA40ERI9_9PEZI|nr:beta-lactamase-like protein [Schizothecium vesticola]
MSTPEPIIHTCFEPRTSTWQYVVADPSTKSAVIIDSVLDFDLSTSTISTETADGLLSLVKENGYTVRHILETHVHADHLTASRYLQQQLEQTNPDQTKPAICIGKRIHGVQERFAGRYGIEKAEYEGAFDRLIDDDDVFPLGELQVQAMHLPGHTPDHMGYMVGANVFCGDSLFNTDVGSARCDFPDGNAHELYASEPRAYTTVAEQKEANKHLKAGTSEAEFVAWRQGRDAGLAEPRLLHQALQFNIRAGRLPAPRGGRSAGLGTGCCMSR